MPDFKIEESIGGVIAGFDEVGRGPLAGPVIAACAIIPLKSKSNPIFQDIRDSKKISKLKREKLFPIIMDLCEVGIGRSEVTEIDQINILQATFKAMQRAYDDLGTHIDHALIDGNKCPALPCSTTPVIKGDDTSLSIATASIVAKVTRDRLMEDLHDKFPEYGWNQNAGYGTKAHIEAIETFGPTLHHRLSFAPLKQKSFSV